MTLGFYIEAPIVLASLVRYRTRSEMHRTQGPRNELLDELAVLSKQQADALEHATYFRMTEEEANEYDRRAERMSEICLLLNQPKAS